MFLVPIISILIEILFKLGIIIGSTIRFFFFFLYESIQFCILFLYGGELYGRDKRIYRKNV